MPINGMLHRLTTLLLLVVSGTLNFPIGAWQPVFAQTNCQTTQIENGLRQGFDNAVDLEKLQRPAENEGGKNRTEIRPEEYVPVENYKRKIEEAKTNLTLVENRLRIFGIEDCGESKFNDFKKLLQERANIVNGHVIRYTAIVDRLSRVDVKKRLQSINRFEFTLDEDYATLKAKKANPEELACEKLLTDTQSQFAAAESVLAGVETEINQTTSLGTTDIGTLAQRLDNGQANFTRGLENLQQYQSQGCDQNNQLFKQLMARKDGIGQRQIKANESLGNRAKNWLSVGAVDAVDALIFKICEENISGKGVLEVFAKPFKRIFCIVILSISAALGNLACLIQNSLIGPVFGTEKICKTDLGQAKSQNTPTNNKASPTSTTSPTTTPSPSQTSSQKKSR